MKRIVLGGMLFAAAVLFFGCAPQGEDPEKMVAAAKELDQQFIAAANKADVDAIMALYWNNPDLVVYPPDEMEAKGWQAQQAGFKNFVAAMPNAKWELVESNYKAAGDVVIGWGKVKLTVRSGGGAPMEMLFRYTDVKTKRDGKWVYILDHGSAPLPPPQAPSPAR